MDTVLPNQGKTQDRDAPGDIADADEKFPLAQLIGQSANEQSGHRSGNGRSRNHPGDLRRGGIEHFIDEHIQVHILHNPGHLAYQGKNHQRKVKLYIISTFFHRKTSVFIYFIISHGLPDVNK